MSAFKFLPGLMIVQAATAVLVVGAIGASFQAAWLFLGTMASILTLVVAFWFRSIADHIKKDSLAQAKEAFAQEREKLLLAAEAEKRTFVEASHERIIKETNRAHARANFKLGAVLASMLCVAAVMLYVQLIAVGLLMLAAAAGALTGYGIRARQDFLANRERAAVDRPYAVNSTETRTKLLALKSNRRER